MQKGEDVPLPPSPKEARSYCAKLTLHHPSVVTTDYSLNINVFTMAVRHNKGQPSGQSGYPLCWSLHRSAERSSLLTLCATMSTAGKHLCSHPP